MLASLLIFTLYSPGKAIFADTKADVAMEVQAGYDGVARLGAYVPYRITLINKGRAVDGEVQIEVKIDSESKTIFAKPASLAEGAVKEIIINGPVFTARKGIKVRFLEKGRTVEEIEYEFKKLIPPEIKTIAILSSDPSAYSYLNGVMIPEPIDPAYMEKINLMRAAGEYAAAQEIISESNKYGTVNKVESTIIPLTGENLPEDVKVLNGFDIIIIGNYDTSTLTGKQSYALEKWLENGGTLVIGTGSNWKKVYSSLPEPLRKFTISGTSSVVPPQDLTDFGGCGFSEGAILQTVTGDIGFVFKKAVTKLSDEEADGNDKKEGTAQQTGNDIISGQKPKTIEQDMSQIFSAHENEVIIGDISNPLAIKYTYHSGRILFLAFDPGMEPFTSWDGSLAFWENLFFHSNITRNFFQRGENYYYSNYANNYNLNDLTSQVPEEQLPPFIFMFVTIAVYIVITGPLLYIFLKKKDKRDYSWIAVPAAAFLCLIVIYFVGFKTRYKTAVFNTASMINLDMSNNRTDIVTGIGIFNNKRGDLKLEYSEDDNIDFDITESGRRSYAVYADGSEPEGKIVSKLVFMEPVSYEIYDVSMWEPKYISARKSEPLTGEIVSSVNISDGVFRAVIKNTTKYDFMETFLTLGSNFIYVGDILSGREKAIEADMNSEDVYNTFEGYLDAVYGRMNYPSNIKPPEDFTAKRRKRMAAERLLQQKYSGIREQTKIGLYALNYQDLDYNIAINGKEPVSYYTNGIFTSIDLYFEKGKEVEIPSGIINPAVVDNEFNTISMDGDNGVRIRSTGELDFIYSIPEGIDITEFSVDFNTYIPLNIKYNIEDMKANDSNFKSIILENKYEYYLYNAASDSWKKIENGHIQSDDVSSYIDGGKKLRVRVSVVEMADTSQEKQYGYVQLERLSFPGLTLKGVGK